MHVLHLASFLANLTSGLQIIFFLNVDSPTVLIIKQQKERCIASTALPLKVDIV